MTILLKNVQIVDSMSDETTCFTADLFYRRARIGVAKNAGQGGSTLIHVVDPAIRQRLERDCVPLCRSLPAGMGAPEIAPPAHPGGEALEWYVDQLLRDHIVGIVPTAKPGHCLCGHVLDRSTDTECRHCQAARRCADAGLATSRDIPPGADDFADPGYATTAVLAQLEDLPLPQRVDVLRDALRQTTTPIPGSGPATRCTPRVIVIEHAPGRFSVIPWAFGDDHKPWFEVVIPALVNRGWAVIPMWIAYPDEPVELGVSVGEGRRVSAEEVSLEITVAMDALDAYARPRDAARPLPPTHIARRPRGRR